MKEYRIVWCDHDQVHTVDGLTLETAQRAFSNICRELRPELAWVHILRMPDRVTYASLDRSMIETEDRLREIIFPRNVGGELAPEDIA